MSSPRSNRSWLAPESPDLVWFSGDDVLRFLNDLISQQISDMDDGESRRSFLLAPNGKLMFMLWVIKDRDRFGLVTEPGRGEELADVLGRYRIRVDVDINPEKRDVWLVMDGDEGFDMSWPGVPRRLLVGDRPDLPTGSIADYAALRVGAGEPAWDVDVDEGTIPHECGLVDVSVDFDKGCYLGQELVARINSRGGNTPRHLRLMDADGPVRVGSTITVGDKEVGTVTSASGSVGLAMVRREVSVGDEVAIDGVTGVVKEAGSRSPGPPAR